MYPRRPLPVPTCPRCGSANGSLGTSYAYFMCGDCNAGNPVYWTADHQHPGLSVTDERDWESAWQRAIDASPWAKARQALERVRPARIQPTVTECAELLDIIK